jgi:hypothetical protein
MKDVRAVAMNKNAMRVSAVIGVTANMRTAVDDENFLSGVCHALCKSSAGKAGPDDHPIKSHNLERSPEAASYAVI